MFPPIRYFLELTYRCNLNCSYCYINHDRVKNEMTTEEWFKIIDQIPFYSFISLVAGEVMIRKDFFEILEKASKKNGGKISIITNGLLLNENSIKEIIKNNVLLLSVSLDGYKEHHDELRSKQGLWNNIIPNLELLNKEKQKQNKIIGVQFLRKIILKHRRM